MGAQKIILETAGAIAGGAIAGSKLNETKRQADEKRSTELKNKEETERAIQREGEETALEADLIRMGADPDSARAFMDARSLGLDTKSFGMIRKHGKFVGSYSSLAEKLSKDSLTDSLASRAISDRGFAKRIVGLGGTRRGRVDALLKASEGGKK